MPRHACPPTHHPPAPPTHRAHPRSLDEAACYSAKAKERRLRSYKASPSAEDDYDVQGLVRRLACVRVWLLFDDAWKRRRRLPGVRGLASGPGCWFRPFLPSWLWL